MADDKAASIHCKSTQKLLARVDELGIYLWCKVCHGEHYVRWSEIDDQKKPNQQPIARR